MKYLFIIILISLFPCCDKIEHTGVEQRLDINCGDLCNTTNRCFVTWVWYKDEIAAAWYDNPYTITDSIVLYRRKQGEAMIAAFKKGE